MTKEVTDANFNSEVVNSSIPVLVDFWAEWCGPCKTIAPIIEELSVEMAGKIKIVKMNVDESPNTPSAVGIRGIPTMIIYKDGQILSQKVGAIPKSSILEWINSVI